MKSNTDKGVWTERDSLISEINMRIQTMSIEELRRVDWYIERITGEKGVNDHSRQI